MTYFWRYGWMPLLFLGLLGLKPPPASCPHPFGTAYWYWHHPFRLTPREGWSLRDAGVERLYVHAGSVVRHGPELRLEQRQQWTGRSPLPLFAVLRVHPGANAALLALGGDEACLRLLQSARLPSGLLGVQLDADVPSAQLAAYAAFLRSFRRRLPPGWKLSITALPDWIERPEWSALGSAVDEIVPQFYGNRLPRNDSAPPPLWEASGMLRRVREATRGQGAAVWVGLPRYGRCVVLDPAGHPAGVRHDLDPEALLDDPGWRVAGAKVRRDDRNRLPLEEQLTLCAETETSAGPFEAPPGTTLWFQWPIATGLSAAVSELRRQPGGAAGVCYFRLPAPDEPLGVPLPSSSTAAASPASLRIRLLRRAGSILVVVENQSESAPLVDPGITVDVSPGDGEVLASSPVQWLQGGEPASSLRADCAVLSRPLLWPGHTWSVCEIREARGAVHVRVRWRDARRGNCSTDAELTVLSEGGAEGKRP